MSNPVWDLDRGLRRTRAAFTLVELLVEIGIIALLMAILLPSLSRAREQSRRVKCLANLRSLGHAMYLYANDFRDRLPNGNLPGDANPANGDQVLVAMAKQYNLTPGIFYCPSDVDEPPRQIANNYIQFENSARVSYDFFSVYWIPEQGPKLSRLRGQAPLAWDLGVWVTANQMQNHGILGGNVIFADGHGEWQRSDRWCKGNWPAPACTFYP